MQTLILDAAATELVKRVVKLCGSSGYYSARGKFAEMLVEYAVEAGILTAEVPACLSANERRAAAEKAYGAMKKTLFCLKAAQEADIFPARRVKPVYDLVCEINASLSAYAFGKKPEDFSGQSDTDGFNDDYIV